MRYNAVGAGMDQATVDYYNANAAACAAKYESADMSHLDHLLLRHLPEKAARVLELGFGSGREAAFLLQNGHDVRAIDASAGMVEEALRRHPELSGRLSCVALPLEEGSRLLGRVLRRGPGHRPAYAHPRFGPV